jgi:hypothetical protein
VQTVAQDGTSSALGLYYQGCYALVALLRERDDGAGVAVETYDDVVLDSSSLKTLSQLKHKAAPLSIKSDDFWKAVGNWIGHLGEEGLRFRFVLTSPLPAGSVLRHLPDNSSHAALCAALFEEAARVNVAADEAQAEAYKRRLAGCRAFLSLSETQRLDLIQRLDVEDDSFSVTEYEPKVAEQLTQTVHGIRTSVAERLIEWWDRQVAIALTGKRSRVLRREEVIETITRITQLFFNDRLPDDFADKEPPQALDDTPVLVRQIKLIEGTPAAPSTNASGLIPPRVSSSTPSLPPGLIPSNAPSLSRSSRRITT